MKNKLFITLIVCFLFSVSFIPIIANTQGTNSEILTISKKLKVFCPEINEKQVQEDIKSLTNKSSQEHTEYLNILANKCRKDDIDNYFFNQDDKKAYEVTFEFLNIIAPLQMETNQDLKIAKSFLPIISYPMSITELVQSNNWLCLPNITGVTLIKEIKLEKAVVNLECNHLFIKAIQFDEINKWLSGFIILWIIGVTIYVVIRLLVNLQKRNPLPNTKLLGILVVPIIKKIVYSALMSILFIILFNGYNISSKLLVHYLDQSNSSYCRNETNLKCLTSSLLQTEQRKLLVNTKADDLQSLSRTSKGWLGILPEIKWDSLNPETNIKQFGTGVLYFLFYVLIAAILFYLTIGFMSIQLLFWLNHFL